MEPDSSAPGFLADISVIFQPFDLQIISGIVAILGLLCVSALISGSEVAFFALSPNHKHHLKKAKSKATRQTIRLLEHPQRLLATILIVNNFVNIAIILLTTYVSKSLVTLSPQWLEITIEVAGVTFLLLLFGEIIPKVYATQNSLRFAVKMSLPIAVLQKIVQPVSALLMKSSSIVNNRFDKKQVSMDEISQALDLTSESLNPEKELLEGIVSLRHTDAKEIMKPRTDVTAVSLAMNFKEVLDLAKDKGYSRLPVFLGQFDNIKGILYLKDLIPHIHKAENFRWQTLMRPPFFIPESKKIDDLLEDFQKRKTHMAIVIDEYGGTSGIVTLEDILEEIVGEISDEFDEDDNDKYKKIDDHTYLFEGKCLLKDFFRLVNRDEYEFDKVRGEAETLAGFILELKGDFPELHEKIKFKGYQFIIEAEDERRIEKIKVIIPQQ